MKVVLDTNVIVAAFAARGLCAELFKVCLSKYEIILSEYILLEVGKNLTKKIKLPQAIVEEILHFLREHSRIVEPELIETPMLKDKKDLPIIGTAIRGHAQFLITGDKELLALRKFESLKILSPREFWKRLKETI